MVRMNFSTHHFTTIVIDIFMAPSVLWQHAIHFEAIGVNEGVGNDALFEKEKDEMHIELLGLDHDMRLTRSTVKKADNGQFVGAVSSFAFDPSDVEALVFALATDVRFIELNRSREHRDGIGSHAYTKMAQHTQCATSWNTGLTHNGRHRPLAHERRDATLPFFGR